MVSARLGLAALLAVVSTTVSAAFTETVTNVPLPRGGTIRIQHYRPEAPIANLYFLAGNNGFLGLPISATDAPQVRYMFVDRGISVILVDLNLSEQERTTPEHAEDLLAVLRAVQRIDDLPAWVQGFSNGGVSAGNLAINAPWTTPFGLVLKSPRTAGPYGLLAMNLERIRRPTIVLTHANDPNDASPPANVPILMSRLSSTVDQRSVVYTGGDPGNYHGLGGLDDKYVDEVVAWIRKDASFVQAPNFQGLWYRGEIESGWGVNLAHQGNILFVTWFTYDSDRSQMWLVGSGFTMTTPGTYTGAFYRTTGSAFNANPFVPISSSNVTAVGTGTFTFTDANSGTFSYTVNGVTQSKPIVRQGISATTPTCTAGGSRGATINFSDLWYRGEIESGWGVNLTHQGDILFATWFTYDSTGKGMWVVGPAITRTTGNTFTGALYRTTGDAFNANPWHALSPADVTQVGNATFSFSDANNGTFSYTVNGESGSKPITRQVFAAPATICN